MWATVLEKLTQLKGVDRQCQAFGADVHGYALRHSLARADLEKVERKVGPLPDALREFYVQVADGVAGPYYGLFPAAELSGYRPLDQYPGIEALRQAALDAGWKEDARPLLPPREVLAGLISIIDEGCGREVCLVANGTAAGRVAYLEANGYFIETDITLVQLYERWLDNELSMFRAVESHMRAGASYSQIQLEMPGAGDLIASIANVEKPAAIFGVPGARTYHGATQFPWYESVLKEWQRKNT